jgi:hypothetical protein
MMCYDVYKYCFELVHLLEFIHYVLETAFISVLRRTGRERKSIGPLDRTTQTVELVKSRSSGENHGSQHSTFSFASCLPEDGNRSNFRNAIILADSRRWISTKLWHIDLLLGGDSVSIGRC